MPFSIHLFFEVPVSQQLERLRSNMANFEAWHRLGEFSQSFHPSTSIITRNGRLTCSVAIIGLQLPIFEHSTTPYSNKALICPMFRWASLISCSLELKVTPKRNERHVLYMRRSTIPSKSSINPKNKCGDICTDYITICRHSQLDRMQDFQLMKGPDYRGRSGQLEVERWWIDGKWRTSYCPEAVSI